MRLGCVHLRLRALQLLGAADSFERFQMLGGGIESALRLNQSDFGVIDELLGKRAFAKQLHSILVDFLGGIEGLVRRFHIGLGFGGVLRHGSGARIFVIRLSLTVELLTLVGGGDEIAIFESGQELAFAHVIAALHEKTGDRRADFRDDICLRDGIKNGFSGDDLGDRLAFGERHLNGRCGLLGAFGRARFRAPCEQQQGSNGQKKAGSHD